MGQSELIEDILIRQAEHQAVLRAICATHPSRVELISAIRLESLRIEALNLGNPGVPDQLRESVIAAIGAWITALESS